jgi:hypothetical protein
VKGYNQLAEITRLKILYNINPLKEEKKCPRSIKKVVEQIMLNPYFEMLNDFTQIYVKNYNCNNKPRCNIIRAIWHLVHFKAYIPKTKAQEIALKNMVRHHFRDLTKDDIIHINPE